MEHLGVLHIQTGTEKAGCQLGISALVGCHTLQHRLCRWASAGRVAVWELGAAGGAAVKDHVSQCRVLALRLVTLGVRSNDIKRKVTDCCHKGFFLTLEKEHTS